MPIRHRSQPPAGQTDRGTDRGTAGGTHLRNTEPGLSGAPGWVSQALSGLLGTSNLNSVSLEDRLFFTILPLSAARPGDKLRGSCLNPPPDQRGKLASLSRLSSAWQAALPLTPALAEALFFKLVNE